MDTQIWQHVTSGERYAVAVNQAGAVIAAAGPLHHSEISVALAGDWDGDPEVAADIQADTASYRDVTEAPRRSR